VAEGVRITGDEGKEERANLLLWREGQVFIRIQVEKR